MTQQNVPVMDYEGSQWRTEFWQGRQYEDAVERIALAKTLPARGTRLVEIGAGFGRLADLYRGYDQIILLDYARSMLKDAVTTPSGTTIDGILELEDGGLRVALLKAVVRATRRASERAHELFGEGGK